MNPEKDQVPNDIDLIKILPFQAISDLKTDWICSSKILIPQKFIA